MTRISDDLRQTVTERARHACEYCHLPDRLQAGSFELDHILPASRGGLPVLDNLAYACPHCNDRKWAHVDGQDPLTRETVPLFHPRQDGWENHFEWSGQAFAQILGKTAKGRVTVVRLQLNHPELLEIRRELVKFGVLVIPAEI